MKGKLRDPSERERKSGGMDPVAATSGGGQRGEGRRHRWRPMNDKPVARALGHGHVGPTKKKSGCTPPWGLFPRSVSKGFLPRPDTKGSPMKNWAHDEPPASSTMRENTIFFFFPTSSINCIFLLLLRIRMQVVSDGEAGYCIQRTVD